MKKKFLYPFLVLLLGLSLAYFIATSKPAVDTEPYQSMTTTVRVIRANAADEYLTISSQGTVQPRTQTELIPEVSGRVVWMSPSLIGGGAFQEGDVLVRIDDADYRTKVRRANAMLERAQVEYEYAAEEFTRMESLFKRELASVKQLDQARRSARVAGADREELRANLEQAKRDLSRTELIAPFNGLVRREEVDVGQFISRGSSIGTLYAIDYVEVRLPFTTDQLLDSGLPPNPWGEIPEEIRPPVTITASLRDIRLEWDGQLIRLESEIDERSRMIYGVARLQQDTAGDRPIIPIGLFVDAEIRGRKAENIFRLPRSVIRNNNQVLVVDDNNRLRIRQVSVLRLARHHVLIDQGLTDGELISISTLQTVVDGMTVQPSFQ